MINLLPPSQKIVILKEKKIKIVLIFEIFFLIFLICFILILLSIKIYIQSQVNTLETFLSLEEKDQKTKDIKDLQVKLDFNNKNLIKINNFFKNQKNTVEILDNIFKKIPPEIIITSFSFKKDDFSVSLTGFAAKRDDLLKLKKNLEEEFNTVAFPPSVWINPLNVNFSVSFKVEKIAEK